MSRAPRRGRGVAVHLLLASLELLGAAAWIATASGSGRFVALGATFLVLIPFLVVATTGFLVTARRGNPPGFRRVATTHASGALLVAIGIAAAWWDAAVIALTFALIAWIRRFVRDLLADDRARRRRQPSTLGDSTRARR